MERMIKHGMQIKSMEQLNKEFKKLIRENKELIKSKREELGQYNPMFWDEEQLNSLQKLLTSEKEATLAEVLDDPYCLQELRQGYQPLLDVLTKHENLLQLVKTALVPDIESEKNIEEQYVPSNFAAEVLSVASIDQLVEAIFKNKECLDVITGILDDPVEKFNSVNAIFFAKVLGTLISKDFDASLELIKENNLLNKCRKFFHYGSIADLVAALIRLNHDEKHISAMKNYLVEEQFVPKLIALLDESIEIPIQENAADIFIDIVRNIREVLAVNDDKNDVLHAQFVNQENIEAILDRMLMKEKNGRQYSNDLRSSLLSNGALMLSSLIEHNTAGITASALIENGDNEPDGWSGGLPGEGRSVFDQTKMWLPDQDKLAEKLIAHRTEALIKVVIEDLEQEKVCDWWLTVLKLISELLNTNCLETHTLVCEGFRKAKFERLFTFIEKYPNMHILQHLLRNIISYVLLSNLGENISPLLEYFIKECELFSLLKKGVYPLENLPKMTTMSIRSFHIYLADSFIFATRNAPKKELIAEIIKNSPDWSGDGEQTVEKGINLYWEKNRPDECKGTSQMSSARTQNNIDTFEDIDAFSKFECTSSIPELDIIKAPHSVLYNFNVNPPGSQKDLRINLRENDPNEENFENAGEFAAANEVFETDQFPGWSMRKDWAAAKLDNYEGWPGDTAEKDRLDVKERVNAADDSDDFWDNCQAANSSDLTWPSSSSNKSNEIKNPFD